MCLFLLMSGLVACTPGEQVIESDGSFIDSRDSQLYHYVNIGTQSWMLENLSYADDDSSGSWCFNDEPGYCEKYGRLYTWDAARSACPQGWHLPADGEWKQMEKFLGMDAAEADSAGWRESGSVGLQIKAGWDWNSAGNGDNNARFTALPGGFRSAEGQYYYLYDLTTFWTATYSSETHAWGRAMIYYSPGVYRWKYVKAEGYSIRCVK